MGPAAKTGDTMAGQAFLKTLAKTMAGFAAATALMLGGVLVGAGSVVAQNYDGDTIIRFGAFGQGAFQNFGTKAATNGVTAPGGSASPQGFGGGFSGGIDYHPHPSWLIGVEIDAAVGEGRSMVNNITYGFDYLATLRGRFGVYPNRDWLLYGTAGIAYLGFEAQNHLTGTKQSETVPGALVGLGAEYNFKDMVLFAEYDYTTFGSRSFSLGTTRFDVDSDAHLLRFGVKFNVGHDFGRMYNPD